MFDPYVPHSRLQSQKNNTLTEGIPTQQLPPGRAWDQGLVVHVEVN